MNQPVIILTRPQMGENIGAAARAMLNFGLSEMRLVAPRDGWPNPRAIAMASGAAGQVLDHARIFATLDEALFDIGQAYGLTARGRDLTKPVLTPAAAVAEAAQFMRPEGDTPAQRVAFVFGPERAGLENDDIARLNAIVTVPVNPDFPSLNLAQAVLLMGYEWGQGRLPAEPLPVARRPRGEGLANRIEIAHLADHYEETLGRAGYFFPETKAFGMKLNLRNMWSRLALTQADVAMLHGALRQLVRRPPRDEG